MKRFMINTITKEMKAYDYKFLYEHEKSLFKTEEWKECNQGYMVLANTLSGIAFQDKSKKGIKYISYDGNGYRVYLLYSNDGKRFLKEYHATCGYDMGPR